MAASRRTQTARKRAFDALEFPVDHDEPARAPGRESFRASLDTLALDVAGLRQELLDGFPDRNAILWWAQAVAVRTLGWAPQRLYRELGRQFRVDEGGSEPALLASLLVGTARRRDLGDQPARRERERLFATVISPAFHRAFKQLRGDASEYVDDERGSTPSGHDPHAQQYTAMRPALDELETHQQRALAHLLVGFDDRAQILDWGETAELATHGEVEEGFVARCYTEGSTRRLLLGHKPEHEEARELFAAHHLLPAFNRGVRDLAGRAGEMPSAKQTPSGGAHL